jgi:protein TonB
MFADVLSDSPWANRSHRGWTTLASFAVQAIAVGVLLLLPLLYTQGLPGLALTAALVVPAPPPGPPSLGHPGRRRSTSNISSDGSVLEPPRIPDTIAQLSETEAPAPVDTGSLSIWGSTGDRRAGSGVVGSTGIAMYAVAPPPPPKPAARVLRPSTIMEGQLVHRVQPEYPILARQARIQGEVVLRAMISREGTIEGLQVVSGHPMLAPAAMTAVRQWRYRPCYLNGEPVEVETQVTVKFILGGG